MAILVLLALPIVGCEGADQRSAPNCQPNVGPTAPVTALPPGSPRDDCVPPGDRSNSFRRI